jgi:hypothetical protein
MDAGMFAGREKVLRTLIRSIEDQQLHVVLFGARGIGKTSTLHILSQIAEEARYLVRYFSCGEDIRFDELFRAVLAEIPLLYHRSYDPTSDEIEEGLTFADLLPAGPLTVSLITDALDKISGTRVLVLLDEFDRASHSNDFRRSIAELIKNLSDRASRVQIVIAGVAQNLNEIIEQIPSIRRNILGLAVPRMADEEVVEIIKIGEAASGLRFTPDSIDVVCSTARGLPYLASLISQHAGLIALDREATIVERHDVVEATRQTLDELGLRLSSLALHEIERLYRLGRNEELGLLALLSVQHGGRLLIDDVVKTTPAHANYLGEIAEGSGLIAPIPGDPEGAFGFVDDAVPTYLWVRYAQGLTNDRTAPAVTTLSGSGMDEGASN